MSAMFYKQRDMIHFIELDTPTTYNPIVRILN